MIHANEGGKMWNKRDYKEEEEENGNELYYFNTTVNIYIYIMLR